MDNKKNTEQRLRYRGKMYYLVGNIIYDNKRNVVIPEATNGFLDLYEYFEYFPQPKIKKIKGEKQ
jgi:hypothetical protein